jgi:hypothetical protein
MTVLHATSKQAPATKGLSSLVFEARRGATLVVRGFDVLSHTCLVEV